MEIGQPQGVVVTGLVRGLGHSLLQGESGLEVVACRQLVEPRLIYGARRHQRAGRGHWRWGLLHRLTGTGRAPQPGRHEAKTTKHTSDSTDHLHRFSPYSSSVLRTATSPPRSREAPSSYHSRAP